MSKYIWIIVILISIIGIFIVRDRFISQNNIVPSITPSATPVPTFFATPTTAPISPTVTSRTNCNVGNIRDTNCPPGCVYYGMPLGCVPQDYNDTCKKTGQCPKCLSSSTSISTIDGSLKVKSLKVGTLVWTINKEGRKELRPIVKLSSTEVSSSHQMVRLIFSDGKELLVSPRHPTITGWPIENLRVGEIYDDRTIVSKEFVSYADTRTYDLLPAGDTGFYFANGIALGSTLK